MFNEAERNSLATPAYLYPHDTYVLHVGKITTLWDMTLCTLVDKQQCCREPS